MTTIEEIPTGRYSGDGFRLFRKVQFNEKLFWYNVFVFHRYISDRIHKNMPAGFRLGSGAGLAGDSKPRGFSVKAGSGGWSSPWAICWWLAGGQLSKAGGRGGCLVCTPPPS